MAKGRVTASTVPDHIVPLDHGGIEDGLAISPNIRCLCDPCHAKRTREQFKHQRMERMDGWRPR